VVSDRAVRLWVQRLETMGQVVAVKRCAVCGDVVGGEAVLRACAQLGVEPRVELVKPPPSVAPAEGEKNVEKGEEKAGGGVVGRGVPHEAWHLALKLGDEESYTGEERRGYAQLLVKLLAESGEAHPQKRAAELSGLSQATISLLLSPPKGKARRGGG